MSGNRDNFAERDKRILGDRVGWRCSKPECRALTKGPNSDDARAVHVGVASHIHAASLGGPRYDPSQTPEQRASIENGIYLCQVHAKLVDDDPALYTADTLRTWKVQAKEAAAHALGEPGGPEASTALPLLRLAVLEPVGGANPMTWPALRYVSPSRFYHLQVSNSHRAFPAHNVQVFLTRIDRRAPDGTFKAAWQGDAAPVWWRYQAEDPNSTLRRTVGAPADLDMCFIVKSPPGGNHTPVLALRVSLIPVNLEPHMMIRPNEPVILHFQARSDQADSEVLRVKVSWNGLWADDDAEMARNLTIETVSARSEQS